MNNQLLERDDPSLVFAGVDAGSLHHARNIGKLCGGRTVKIADDVVIERRSARRGETHVEVCDVLVVDVLEQFAEDASFEVLGDTGRRDRLVPVVDDES